MPNIADAHTAITSLKGRRALITGGTTGIGRAVAVLLASAGAKVFICGRDADHLADALARIREVGDGDGIAIDLAEPQSVDTFFAAGKTALGGFDIAVVNAAVSAEGLSDMGADAVRYAIATDFTAYVMSAHAAVNMLDKPGDLVFTGSVSAHVLGPGSTVYAGIKAGIAGFAEALRREVGKDDIRVALVEPGKTGADMQYPDIPAAKQRAMIEEAAMLRAEDIAVAVQYILTQPSRTVVQQLMIVPRAQEAE